MADSDGTPLDHAKTRGVLNDLVGDLPGVVYRCRMDDDWTMLGLTEGVEALTGWTAEELVESAVTSWKDLIHPEDRKRVREEVHEGVEAGEAFRTVYRIRTRQGEERYLLEQGRRVEEEGQDILTGYIQDVEGPLAGRLAEVHDELAASRRESAHLHLLHAVTRIVNEVRVPRAALERVVHEVCRALDFPVGHAFVPDEEGSGLSSAGTWHLDEGKGLDAFVEATEGGHWKPREGLPGRVMETGRAEWVVDLTGDPDFLRLSAEAPSPVGCGVGVPVVSGDRTLAVMEFYRPGTGKADPEIVETLEQVGVQLGRVWERSEADRDRRISDQLFHQLAERGEMVFWMSTLQGDILYLSPGFEKLAGPDVPLTGWRDLVQMAHPEDRDELAELLSQPDRAPYEIEYRILPGDEVRWISQKAFPVVGEDGRMTRVGGLAEDVTGAHRARERLEETGRLLQRTFASLNEAVLVIDTSGEGRGVVEVNEAAERIFGYSREELLGDTTEKLHADRESFERFAEEGEPRLREDGVFLAKFSMRRKDGAVFPAEQTVTLLDPEQGIQGGAVSVVRDLSEQARVEAALHRTEERFRTLIEQSADIIGILDRDLVTGYVSPSVTRVLGYRPEELVGTHGRDRVHPEDREHILAELRDFVHRHGETLVQNYRMLHRDGSVRWVEARSRNLLHEPVVEGIVTYIRDLTDRKELEHQLLQAQKMEAVGRLAGGVAHDFNNLLSVIRGQADFILLDLEAEDEELAEEIRVVRDAADRAARLTNQLLAFGREQVLRPQVVDLNRIVSGMHQLLRRVLGEDVAITMELEKGLPPIRVDPVQLEQVLMNMAVNARDAMPGGGTLTLATGSGPADEDAPPGSPGAAGGRVVRVEVRDTGIGMDEETRRRIFEPFFTTKGESRGTGLGLSTSYGIVQQSGGSVDVESQPGAGTAFTLTFPAADGVAEEETIAPGEEDHDERLEESRYAAVVVEDDPSVRRVARRILERAGLRVYAVEDAEAGLAEIRARGDGVDLLLTDLVLTGMGGRELVELLLEERSGLAMVVMSGYAEGSPGSREDLPAEVGFIQKPFTPEGLIEAVRRKLSER